MKATVIVPFYNIEQKVFDKCIESILHQTLRELEILIIDDGSDDEYASICDRFTEIDDRISVIHKKNEGVSTCRNYGIEEASGDWIAFVDGDDWLESNYLEKLISVGELNKSDIVLCDCYIDYEHNSVKNRFFSDDILDSTIVGKDRFILQFWCTRIYEKNLSSTDSGAPWAKIYRREFILRENIRFDIELRRMQDNVFNVFAYEAADKIFYFSENLYHYRKSNNSGFTRFNPNIFLYYCRVFDYYEDYIIRNNKSENYYKALDYKIIFSMYVILKIDLANENNECGYNSNSKKLNDILNNKYYKHALENVDKKLLSCPEKILHCVMKTKSLFLLRTALKCKEILFFLLGRGI